jgi:hypothetical protein
MNKTLLTIIGSGLAVVVIAGGLYFLKGDKDTPKPEGKSNKPKTENLVASNNNIQSDSAKGNETKEPATTEKLTKNGKRYIDTKVEIEGVLYQKQGEEGCENLIPVKSIPEELLMSAGSDEQRFKNYVLIARQRLKDGAPLIGKKGNKFNVLGSLASAFDNKGFNKPAINGTEQSIFAAMLLEETLEVSKVRAFGTISVNGRNVEINSYGNGECNKGKIDAYTGKLGIY